MDNHLLRKIGSFTRSIQHLCDTKYRDLNLQKGQFMFLMRICENPGIGQKELSDLISVEKSTTTRALQKLEKDGYIYREKSPHDSRSVRVFPSESGLSIYPELARYELQLYKSVTSNLNSDELHILTKLFEKLQNTPLLHSNGLNDPIMQLTIIQVDHAKEMNVCREIRKEVFQIGQKVAEAIDFDGKDHESFNFIAYLDNYPVATCRLRPLDDQLLKFERLAVLPNYRNLSIASSIIEYANVFAKSKGYKQIKLHAQMSALSLYIRAGYKIVGKTFYEANIEHVLVKKSL